MTVSQPDPFHLEDPAFPPPTAVPDILAGYGHDRAVAAWLAYHWLDADAVRAKTSIGEMRGHWYQCAGFPFPATFRPSSDSKLRAIVIPIEVDGQAVDILAIDKADSSLWGVVTGAASFVNDADVANHQQLNPTNSLRVHRNPIDWLRYGCEGVVPLRFSSYPTLRRRGVYFYVAEDIERAEELAERIFEAPQFPDESHFSYALRVSGSDKYITVDSDDLDDEIIDRVAVQLAAGVRQ